MKKLLSLIAALLPCFLAHSQEADNLGSYAEVKLVSRLDLNPTYSLGEAEMGFDFGNSILCTTFEGAASEHFSLCLEPNTNSVSNSGSLERNA